MDPPVVFVDVAGQQKWLKRFGSPINGEEIDTVTEVVEAFIDSANHPESELGVITPYRAQGSLIGDEITNYGDVEVSTVDGFQGRERSTIVFSTVDTEPSGLEFSGNENRFNVASTRPKDQFVMVGDRTAIEEHASWGSPLRRFIRYASSTGGVFDWDSGEWVDGVDLDDPVPVEPDAETESPDDGAALSDEFDMTEETPSRILDIAQLAPTSNGELADAWGLSSGSDAWDVLSGELSDYFERDAEHKIQPSAAARDIVESVGGAGKA